MNSSSKSFLSKLNIMNNEGITLMQPNADHFAIYLENMLNNEGIYLNQSKGAKLVMNIEKVEINDDNIGFISISADELKTFYVNTKSRKRRLRRKISKQ